MNPRQLLRLCSLPLLLWVATGCQQDPYQQISLGDFKLPDLGTADTAGCVPTNGGVEICDGVDNNCNGQIDEGINTQTDPKNCGKCGNSCLKAGALSTCELGKCKYMGCAPGFIDLNNSEADGCEYACTPTNGGKEECDGKDNDCNGETDEIFDLKNDANNCGVCGKVCQLGNASSSCKEGVCTILACNPGYIDKDKQNDNGCEDHCEKTNGGTEICDGLDNDCNGVVDDPGGVPIDIQNDPLNCGACDVTCARANALTACQGAKCVITGCLGSLVDADKDPTNGCECTPEGPEVCDGKDNDCNGNIDDNVTTGLGACGSNVGECKPGILSCEKGVKVCTGAVGPVPETCDGKDNDCDGKVDNGLPTLGVCGSNTGECQQGTLVCKNGAPTCQGGVGPTTEICDGRDNDCDGTPDNGIGDLGSCGSSVGECKPGTRVCKNGVVTCEGATGPVAETCDGKDNDCNGLVDNDLPTLGLCGSAVGECKQGTNVCKNGAPVCEGAVGATAEICDGKDNNCDGQIDENVTGLGSCGSSVGECKPGTQVCRSGVVSCEGGTGPVAETCDGKDNDCNGVVDNDLPSLGLCGSKTGECKQGTLVCQNGAPTCQGAVGPVPETCDGKDNDCNGTVDDGIGSLGSCGSSVGECKPGTRTCQAGVVTCVGGTGPVPETCDGKDNDCNGVVDNDLPTLGLCGSATGECKQGTLVCQNGAPTCQGAVGPVPETCDGKDNNCNGIVDDGIGSLGPCGSAVGECKQGTFVCQAGVKTCQGAVNPVGESCDGKDNDCDGTVDNNLPTLGLCGSAVGECKQGTQVCQLGSLVCQGAVGPQVESCDGKDNDCDGIVDNKLPPLGSCGLAIGECKQGTWVCSGGVADCSGDVEPVPEICDGKDNNCDGVIDNGVPTLGICGLAVGECKQGTLVCQNGAPTCTGNTPPAPETCDGKDNNCDGSVDNGLGSLGSCGSAVGTCKQGTWVCQSGSQVCVGEVKPSTEYCDGKDTDCNGSNDPAACVFAATGREKRLDEPANATLGANNSVQLAVAGLGDQVMAVWLDRRNGRSDVYGNVSTNGGSTYRAADIRITPNAEANDKGEPKVVYGGLTNTSGRRVYVAYEVFNGQRDIYLRRSLDGGVTFAGNAVQVEKLNAGTQDALYVRLAVSPGATAGAEDKVVVCWEHIYTNGATRPNVSCHISVDSGVTFSGNDVQVNGTNDNAIVPQLAVDGSYAYVAWQQGTTIRVKRAPLASPLVFANETALSAQAGQNPVLGADGTGTVLVVWEDVRGALIDIRANRSTNFGLTWLADGVRVDNDVVNGDSIDPAIALRPGGRVFVAWADTSRGQTDIYTNYSDDGGQSWGVVAKRVDAQNAGTSASFMPSIAVAPAGNSVYVAWEDYRNGVYRDVYFSVSLDSGVTWNIPDYRLNESTPAGAADAQTPLVFAATSRVAVIWVDNRVLQGGVIRTGPNADIYGTYLQ